MLRHAAACFNRWCLLVSVGTMTLCNWQICHQTHVSCGCTTFVPHQIKSQINTVPNTLLQGGAQKQRIHSSHTTPCHRHMIIATTLCIVLPMGAMKQRILSY